MPNQAPQTHMVLFSQLTALNNTHIMLNITEKSSTVCSGKRLIRQSLGGERAALQAVHANGAWVLRLWSCMQPNAKAFSSCLPANMLKASIQGSDRTNSKGLKGICCFVLGVHWQGKKGLRFGGFISAAHMVGFVGSAHDRRYLWASCKSLLETYLLKKQR